LFYHPCLEQWKDNITSFAGTVECKLGDSSIILELLLLWTTSSVKLATQDQALQKIVSS
jgi:hypothetical protein